MTTRWPLAVLLVVACTAPEPDDEALRRDRFVAQIAAAEGMLDVWSLVSRADVAFAEGFSPIEELPAAGEARPTPVRWVGARALLRLRGGGRRLEVRGRVDLGRLFARPRATVILGDAELASQVVADDGSFALVADVGPGTGWRDVYLTLSTVTEPWREPAELRVARVEHVGWNAP
jgi:hypothetical protein